MKQLASTAHTLLAQRAELADAILSLLAQQRELVDALNTIKYSGSIIDTMAKAVADLALAKVKK